MVRLQFPPYAAMQGMLNNINPQLLQNSVNKLLVNQQRKVMTIAIAIISAITLVLVVGSYIYRNWKDHTITPRPTPNNFPNPNDNNGTDGTKDNITSTGTTDKKEKSKSEESDDSNDLDVDIVQLNVNDAEDKEKNKGTLPTENKPDVIAGDGR